MKRGLVLGLTLFLLGSMYFLNVNLAQANCGKISGEIQYAQELSTPITVLAMRIPPTLDDLFYSVKISQPGPYEIKGLPGGLYWVTAFIDLDASQGPNPGEPVGFYPEFVLLKEGDSATDIDFNLFPLPSGTGSISGKVAYQGNQTGPVKIISLGISYTPFNYEMVNLTVDSTFKIDHLKAGKYILIGYMDVNHDGLPGLSEPFGYNLDFTTVTEGMDTPNIPIRLNDQSSYRGAISGKVTYTGTQMAPIFVGALGLSRTPIVPSVVNPIDHTYRISGLANGKYTVFAFMDLNGDEQPDATEPMGYYAGPMVNVRNGQETPNIDLAILDPVPGNATVKGSVDYAGDYLANPMSKMACHNIVVQALGLSKTPIVSTKLTEPGDYELQGLAGGLYLIMAYADEDQDHTYDFGEPIGFYHENFILLTDGQTKRGVDITLNDFADIEGSISGTVSYQGTESGEIQILGFGFSGTPVLEMTLDEPGDYEFTDVGSGIYLILAFMDLNENGKYEWQEPFGLYPQLTTVIGPDATENIDIVLADKGTGGISGTVYYQGNLSGKIYVGTVGLSSTPFKKISLAAPGNYELSELSTGAMLVWAFMDVNGDKLPGPSEPMALKPEIIYVLDGQITPNVHLYLKTYNITELEPRNSTAMVAIFDLQQNYPNPFNATTQIEYRLPVAAKVRFRVYDALGKELVHLTLGQQSQGIHTLHWDGKDDLGQTLASGLYFYQLEAGASLLTRKLLLIR